MNMGPNNEKINLVIMGDGYTESELTKYISDAENIREALFSFSSFKELRSYFNVFTINVQSNESGATAGNPNNPVTTKVDNYFGSTFYLSCNPAIERLLGPIKKGKVRKVHQNHVPEYNLGIIIVNSTQYGGSGGTKIDPYISSDVGFGEHVNISFDYNITSTFNFTVNEDTDVWIYCYPQSNGSSIPDYDTWASGPYSVQGTATVEFTVTTTPVIVDEIMILMTDSSLNPLIQT